MTSLFYIRDLCDIIHLLTISTVGWIYVFVGRVIYVNKSYLRVMKSQEIRDRSSIL